MAEEAAPIVAEPVSVAEAPIENFGSLEGAFDKAFPSTVGKKEEVAPVVEAEPVVVETVVPEKKVETAAVPAAVDDGLLPDDVFGDKPVVPEKKPEPQVEVPANIKDPKAIENWKQLRTGYDERGKKLEAVESELADLRKKAETPVTDEGLVARLAEFEAMNKELSERISTVDLQAHPEFQRQFVQARQKLVGNALEIAKEAGLNPSELEHAMGLTGKAKIEALDEIVRGIDSPTIQGELGALVKDINTLDRNRAAVLADSKGNLERLRQHAKAQEYAQLQEHTKFIDKTIDAQVERLANTANVAFFRKIEGNEAWNKDVEAIIHTAKEVATNGKDEGQLLGGLLLGAAFPKAYNALVATRKRVKALEAQLAEFKDADPSLNGSRALESADAPADKGLTFAEAVARGSGLR